MAVRRRLRELLQDLQPLGTIVLERTANPANPANPTNPANPAEQPPPPPPPSAPLPPAAEPDGPPQRRGVLPELCAVFHCRDCWTVLGDSLQLCSAGTARLGCLVCFKVTADVVWEESLLVGLEAPLLGCAYNALCCRSCGLAVGFILYSASSDLASLRGLFCFFKDRILCYLLKNQMVVEASKVDFPAVTLMKQVEEMKEELVEVHCRIDLLTKKLEELGKNKSVEQQQSSASEADDLVPGYARAKIN